MKQLVMRLWFGILVVMTIATRAAFTGAIADAPVRGAGVAISSAPEGGWTWPFTDPRAIQYGGVVYYGYIRGSDGSVVVADTTGTKTVLASAFEVDDHDAPALLVRGDGRLMAFYTKHPDTTIRYRVSTNPLPDISAFDSEQTIGNLISGGHTYAIPVLSDSTIRVFSRTFVSAQSSDPEMHMSVSTDNGATWASAAAISDLVYHKAAVDADGYIHFLGSDHPGDGATSIYHFYMDPSDGSLHQSDGTLISATRPIQGSDMTLVYDGSTTRGWIWDIAVDTVTGYPVATFATFPGNDGSDHRAQRAEWDGDSWNITEVAAMGTRIPTADVPQAEPFYSGGIVIDRADTRLTYVSRKVGSDWHIFRYPGAVQLTTGTAKHVRPVAVRDPVGVRVLWMTGTYTDYLHYSSGTSGSSG